MISGGYVLASVAGDCVSLTDFGPQVTQSVGGLHDGEGEVVHTFSASSGERSKLVKLGRCVWNSEGSLMANAVLQTGGGQDSHGGGLKKSSLVLTTSSGVGGRGGGQATSTKVELSLPTTNASPLKEVAFCGKSQLVLGTERRVRVYDLAGQKVRREFSLQKGDHKLTSMAVNPKETHLAVGCDNGTLQLFNLVSGVVSSPIAANSPSAKGMAYIEALRYNSFQASMVAGACESGHVGIWDANGNRFVHAFSDHKGPATGIVFSPVNAALMASTALDKKCILYDSQVKRKLSSIRVAEPLTSVDLNRDGSTLALGDTRGQVWIYDLRATQQPLHLQKSAAGGREGGPTSSVSFLSPDFASSSSSRSQTSVKRGATKTTSNSAAAIYDDIKENLHKNNQLPPDESGGGNVLSAKKGGNNDSVSSLFSPLRESSPAVGHLPTSPGRHLPNDNSHLSAAGAPDRKLSTDSFFSPLRENTSITNIDAVGGNGGSFCRTPKTAPSSAFNSPLTSIKEESGNSPVKTKKSIVTTLQHQLLAQAEASSPGAVTASSQLGLHRKTSTESLLSPLRSATSELTHLTPKNNPTSAFNSPLAAIREESSTSPVKSTASNQASNDEVFSTPVPPSHHSTQVGSSSQVPRPPPLPVAGVAGFSPRQVSSVSLASTPTNRSCHTYRLH